MVVNFRRVCFRAKDLLLQMNCRDSERSFKRTHGATLIVRACLCLSIIISGLALRGFGFGLGLSPFFVKYGGSMLWAAMVFFLVAIAASSRARWSVALISASIAICVELFRLVHAPWLDAFRLTTAGALLLGRIFSPWNMLAYGVGIIFGMLLDRFGMWAFTKPAQGTQPSS
jgi:Protein of unknown function (DUF2809)